MPRNTQISNTDKQQAWDLFAEITKHRFLYHVLNLPLITDAEYDQLIASIREINERTAIPELLSVINRPSCKNKRGYPLYQDYIQEIKDTMYNKIISI